MPEKKIEPIVEIKCTVARSTDKAVLITDGTRNAWIPRSQISDESDDSIFIPLWLATEKGLV